MGLELITACLLSCALAITYDKVVLPKMFSNYEKRIEEKANSKRVFLNISEKSRT